MQDPSLNIFDNLLIGKQNLSKKASNKGEIGENVPISGWQQNPQKLPLDHCPHHSLFSITSFKFNFTLKLFFKYFNQS